MSTPAAVADLRGWIGAQNRVCPSVEAAEAGPGAGLCRSWCGTAVPPSRCRPVSSGTDVLMASLAAKSQCSVLGWQGLKGREHRSALPPLVRRMP